LVYSFLLKKEEKLIYIIGDVHGCYKTLLALIAKLPNKNAKIAFVGDLIDRGKNSRDVIAFIRNNHYDCILGNHEKMMIDSFEHINTNNENSILRRWIEKGGAMSTIKNYQNKEDMIEDVNFLKTLPLYIEYKNIQDENGRYLVISHSSVGKAWNLKDSINEEDKEQFEAQVLWSRNRHCNNSEIFNVYGHTILDEVYLNEYNANIDLGCYAKDKMPNPRLCAFEFPSMKIIIQENIED